MSDVFEIAEGIGYAQGILTSHRPVNPGPGRTRCPVCEAWWPCDMISLAALAVTEHEQLAASEAARVAAEQQCERVETELRHWEQEIPRCQATIETVTAERDALAERVAALTARVQILVEHMRDWHDGQHSGGWAACTENECVESRALLAAQTADGSARGTDNRVARRDRIIADLELGIQRRDERVAALTAALEWYADSSNYEETTRVLVSSKPERLGNIDYESTNVREDDGARARAALLAAQQPAAEGRDGGAL